MKGVGLRALALPTGIAMICLFATPPRGGKVRKPPT